MYNVSHAYNLHVMYTLLHKSVTMGTHIRTYVPIHSEKELEKYEHTPERVGECFVKYVCQIVCVCNTYMYVHVYCLTCVHTLTH